MYHHHPYDTFGGVFVPHFLLSSRRISLGAKLLYALLATRIDLRGESLLNHDLLACEMGVAEAVVLSLSDELSAAGVIQIWQDPAGTKTLRCQFPPGVWQREEEEPERQLSESLKAETNTAPRLLRLPVFATAEPTTPAGSPKFMETERQPESMRAEAHDRRNKRSRRPAFPSRSAPITPERDSSKEAISRTLLRWGPRCGNQENTTRKSCSGSRAKKPTRALPDQ